MDCLDIKLGKDIARINKLEPQRMSDDNFENIYDQTKFFNTAPVVKWLASWLPQAACLNNPDVNVKDFFTTETISEDRVARKKKVSLKLASVCLGCPVAAQCLTNSLWQESTLARLDTQFTCGNHQASVLYRYGFYHSFPQEREYLSNVLQKSRVTFMDYHQYIESWVKFRRCLPLNICLPVDVLAKVKLTKGKFKFVSHVISK